MKLSEFKEKAKADSGPRLLPQTTIYVPPPKGSTLERDETISLCMGHCPQCDGLVTTEINYQLRKTFYQCQREVTHFFMRESTI